MSTIITDTNKMKKDGELLKKLTNKYKKTIQKFELTTEDIKKSWSGKDADEYLINIKNNIHVYEEVGIALEQYSDFLINEANKIETFVKQNNIE